eukprot:2825151-Pleurochrysis_carterae.AAC.1
MVLLSPPSRRRAPATLARRTALARVNTCCVRTAREGAISTSHEQRGATSSSVVDSTANELLVQYLHEELLVRTRSSSCI